jgi:predicted RNA polymerase sigma factor
MVIASSRLSAQTIMNPPMTSVRHVELVEDAVQSALASALTAWVAKGLPRDPSAWLYRAACNDLVGALRKATDAVRELLRRGCPTSVAASRTRC